MNNNPEARKRFLMIQTLFRRMSFEEICVVVESYYIWRTLTFSRSIPEVGKDEAEKMAKTMSLYKDFFMPTEQSHLQIFILGLMKLFDKDPQALSIHNLIKRIQINKHIITSGVLADINPHLKAIGAIPEKYSPINEKDVEHFYQLQEKYKNLIGNLKNIRDKQFAHTDMKINNGTFVPNEIENLIEDVQGIFNKLSNGFDLSATTWDHLKDDSIRNTKFLLENLERGEKQRLKEIKEKWGV